MGVAKLKAEGRKWVLVYMCTKTELNPEATQSCDVYI